MDRQLDRLRAAARSGAAVRRQHLSTRRARARLFRTADRPGAGRRAGAVAGRLRSVDVQSAADHRTGGDDVRRLVRHRSVDRIVVGRSGRWFTAHLQYPSLDPASALAGDARLGTAARGLLQRSTSEPFHRSETRTPRRTGAGRGDRRRRDDLRVLAVFCWRPASSCRSGRRRRSIRWPIVWSSRFKACACRRALDFCR